MYPLQAISLSLSRSLQYNSTLSVKPQIQKIENKVTGFSVSVEWQGYEMDLSERWLRSYYTMQR